MTLRQLLLGLALLPICSTTANAQFYPREAMAPVELSAQKLPADRTAPTPEQRAQIEALETQAGVNRPCNAASMKDLLPARRALLALYKNTYGPAHPATARPLYSLLCHFAYNTKTDADRAERKQIIARLVAIGRDRKQPQILAAALSARASVALEQPGAVDAIDDAKEALALSRQLFASNPKIMADATGLLAWAYEGAARPVEAEPLREEAITWLRSGPQSDPFVLVEAYGWLADNLIRQMRSADAKVWYDREFDVLEAAVPGADVNGLERISLYGQRFGWINPDRAEALFRKVLAQQERQPGSTDSKNWMTLWNLGKTARLRGAIDAAIAYQRRVIAAIGPGPDGDFVNKLAQMLSQRKETAAGASPIFSKALSAHPDDPAIIEDYANNLWTLGKFEEVLPLRRRSIEIANARFGPAHRETLRLTQNLAVALWMNQRPAEALPYYEAVLAGYRSEFSAIPEAANAAYRQELSGFVSTKASELLKLYWAVRGKAESPSDAAARAKGFAAAQLAHPSVSAAAIGETAARVLAERSGKAAAFARWVKARDAVMSLDKSISDAAQRGTAADAERTALLARRPAVSAELEAAGAALRSELPQVFAMLRPEPVPLGEVTGRSGLLHPDEALVLLYPGMPKYGAQMSRGLVFAVTREGSAWSEIALDGIDLATMVSDLHSQLGHPRNSGITILEPGENTSGLLRYDRAAAHRLYRALFGDPAVAALLAGKRRWTLVPEGPLLSLNFAALVAAPPPGGPNGDFDPGALRATRWLGLDKVLAVMPSVDAVRLARKGPAAAAAAAAGGFFGMGDPAFRGVSDPPGQPLPGTRRGLPDAATSAQLARQPLSHSGVADPAMLAKLPRLDFSAAEVTAVASELHAPADRLRLQLAATQRALEQSSADGTLGKSGLVLFSTHALISGSFEGSLAEPALALTPGPALLKGIADPHDDGLLTASEVAQLQFNSALVILSACNTASGAEGGDGFSGLTRAFLLAGARSVLATYSPVVDEVGAQLTTAAIAGYATRHGDIAEALRAAMRTVAADPALDERGESMAHPAAWAVYVAVDPN
ncbi:hypothetical protein NSE01_05750 [Novosphingobium sediminis]|uniref:CHAT domain-containing protein n=1 Tax=Novosphingobium sediminis TaxID=707214 RepID=A0A512AGH5_9SPHN|nr:CHAT domain-containing tetratricopeptide repeat protein [Novosphingobium sediminis]GEN98742.1 hypothetical protein NSE01_05750 [Novosphingobium sediminis]